MESAFSTTDWIVLALYFLGMVAVGLYFYRRSQSPEAFTAGGRNVPGWVCGLSIFATYLSSISYLALAGKSFTGNWNAFVFSLSIPLAAWVASKYFLPYYRQGQSVSAYARLEERFGTWARVFASSFYLLYQIARIAVVLYLMALPMQVIFGWDIYRVLLVTGLCVTAYSLTGGILAVLWSDAIQAIVLMVGAAVCLFLMLGDIPGGLPAVTEAAWEQDKFSLGGFDASLLKSTFWVVLFFGIVENLKNFGIDQSYIQRYVAAGSEKKAQRALWLGALLYIPVSALFFLIGTCLFVYYGGDDTIPAQGDLTEVREVVARQELLQEGIAPTGDRIEEMAGEVPPTKLGDRVFPHFIADRLPSGIRGLLVAAIFAAAMGPASTGLNSSATLLTKDFYRRFLRPEASPKQEMAVLRLGTVLWGAFGTGLALLLVRLTQSALDMWWILSGILGGGMTGLFLLGMASKKATRRIAIFATSCGMAVIAYLTLPKLVDGWTPLVHASLIPVFGVATILLVGFLATRATRRAGNEKG